jgi:NAD(P)-dependent dehydrogenase (short-subunit alcohol dehydrogenase family)
VGLSLAEKLVAAGATVIVLDIAPHPSSMHESIKYFRLDVGKYADIEKMKRDLDSEKIYPTIIVNNAGIHNGCQTLTESSFESIERYEKRLQPAFYC